MSEPLDFPYATFLDIKFAPLTVVDVPPLVRDCKDQWYNQTLCKVNDSVIRLGVMQGEYHWHKHDSDDEFFFVLDGIDHSHWRSEASTSGLKFRTLPAGIPISTWALNDWKGNRHFATPNGPWQGLTKGHILIRHRGKALESSQNSAACSESFCDRPLS